MQTTHPQGVHFDPPLPVRLKLSALWASLTFCYLYGDYFGLYKPGKLQHMLDGAGPMGPATQGSLLFVAITMPGAWWFYLAYSGIEIALCAVIAWLAWRWPRMAPAAMR